MMEYLKSVKFSPAVETRNVGRGNQANEWNRQQQLPELTERRSRTDIRQKERVTNPSKGTEQWSLTRALLRYCETQLMS